MRSIVEFSNPIIMKSTLPLIWMVLLTLWITNYLTAQWDIDFEKVAEGFQEPIGIVHAGDDDLYIIERQGKVQHWIRSQSPTTVETFMDISDLLTAQGGEQGLLGLAFHPTYPDSPYCYVNYTDKSGNTTVSRFSTTVKGQYRIADPTSEKILLRIDQPYSNHNGGQVWFGPDDYLYIATGDGGLFNDPGNRAQDLTSLLGKILRIDINHGDPYGIPSDNPFAMDDFAQDEIWAYGLRNPWRNAVDPATGALYIADVGQNAWEEVNYQSASSAGGENYGWVCYEASEKLGFVSCDESMLVFPVYAYPHDPSGGGCPGSITGGVVYRGSEYPDLDGVYFFADYCTGVVRSMKVLAAAIIVDTALVWQKDIITSFGQDIDGEVYITGYLSGQIYKLRLTSTSVQDQTPAHSAIHWIQQGQDLILSEVVANGKIYTLAGEEVWHSSSTFDEIRGLTLPGGVYLLTGLDQDGHSIHLKILWQ